MNNMSTSNRLRMDGKKAVVTGGAAGIGKCIVKTLAEGGAKVFFIDNSKDDIDRTGKEFSAAGLDAVPYIGDIADESVLKEFAAFVLGSAPNGIDLLVNNACISRGGLNTYCSYVDFNYVLRVGISAPYMLTQLFPNISLMVRQSSTSLQAARLCLSPTLRAIAPPKVALSP